MIDFFELREAYKTPAEAGAFEDGKKAARKGKKYEDNPHKKGTNLHLWWSKGHNKVRESVELGEAKISVGDRVTLKPNKNTLDQSLIGKAGVVTGMLGSKPTVKFANGKTIAVSPKDLTINESVELDELSNDTLKSYRKKAVDDVASGKKTDKRVKGVERSSMKIRRKEFSNLYRKEAKEEYPLYHKTYSGAMQAAYAYAKKKGFEVDNDDIDRKVATGPRKPSNGKTNSFTLKLVGQKNKMLAVQVTNLDNQRYELNTYIT